jgi:uncharacterized protein (TIGR03089 family)
MAGSAGSVGEGAAARLAADPARPLITWYDDATGDRAELSGATLANWVAKTANLLVDGCGLGPGDRAAVLLPPHWQTAAVLLGCWSAGLVVVGGEPAPVDVLFTGPESLAQAERWPATDRYALALAPLAAPLRTVPPGFADYVVEVRVFGDYFSAYAQSDELARRALDRAAELGIGGGDRLLIDAGVHGDPVDWLLAPLLSGASTVLCGHLDRDRLADRVAAERVSRVL